MTNDFEKVFDTAAEPQDYTGRTGFCTAAVAGHRKKHIRQMPPCSGDRHRQNVTASGRGAWSVKPPSSAGNTLTP